MGITVTNGQAHDVVHMSSQPLRNHCVVRTEPCMALGASGE
eukprot:CAMPEP_0184497618 /NCGR_PEP_ID=MMETSP0113_2-20130426/37028_1 /TAXON_ID=91329 /ORGANISM="Norrisiella sphaerica, Strain BC52" /LENGTH=40 /DNA_ID= /DNA_START= /DNA_END= /DNA_ORIENTATION=